MDEADRVRRLEPPVSGERGTPVPMVLDTDAANEIDDQFALSYALLCPDRVDLQAVYAAPFMRPDLTPAEGMHESFAEIERVLERFDRTPAGFAFEGSTRWLGDSDAEGPVHSRAAQDLIERARSRPAGQEPLYVVAIGAATNVASALLEAPDIAERIVVVWLGGHPTTWLSAREYNLEQDPAASHVLFDSGVPLVHVPCANVTEHLRTTLAEIDRYVRPRGRIGAYLAELFEGHRSDHAGRSKEIWDLGAVSWVIEPSWAPSALVHSPILTADLTWSRDPRRHFVRELLTIHRDEIFSDFFVRLNNAPA